MANRPQRLRTRARRSKPGHPTAPAPPSTRERVPALAVAPIVIVVTVNLLALNLGLTAYIVVGAWVEERKLLRVFGEPYARYQARTSFLIPWPPRRR